MDLADGSHARRRLSGYGEVIVDCNLDNFTTAAEAREIAAELEQIAVILDGMTHALPGSVAPRTATWPMSGDVWR